MENKIEEAKSNAGIGGWLILVLIGLIITPIKMIISFINDFIPLLDSMSMLDAFPNLQTMIYFETIGNGAFGVFAVVLLFIMLNKDARFPKLMIIFYVSNLIFVLGDAIYVSQMPELEQFVDSTDSLKEISRAIVSTAIWVPYMRISTRVKNTFVK